MGQMRCTWLPQPGASLWWVPLQGVDNQATAPTSPNPSQRYPRVAPLPSRSGRRPPLKTLKLYYTWASGCLEADWVLAPDMECRHGIYVPAAHWWLSGNVKLGLIWGSVVHCDVFVLVCCAFCMLGNVHLMFLEVLDTHLVKVQGGGYFFWRRGGRRRSVDKRAIMARPG